MSRLFRLQVDPAALTDALFEFITDPRPSRNDRPVIEELHDVVADMVPIVESMVIDGVDQRQDVADYVYYVVAGEKFIPIGSEAPPA